MRKEALERAEESLVITPPQPASPPSHHRQPRLPDTPLRRPRTWFMVRQIVDEPEFGYDI